MQHDNSFIPFRNTNERRSLMTMEESLMNIRWLNISQKHEYILLIHTTLGKGEPMRIRTDSWDNFSQRRQISRIQQRNNFKTTQISWTIDPEKGYDSLRLMKHSMDYLLSEKVAFDFRSHHIFSNYNTILHNTWTDILSSPHRHNREIMEESRVDTWGF
jgi:hypothetical protein